jgi:hypothetical protein
MQDMEQAIRERAYQLWVESGFEHGNAEAHWLSAQREVLAASLAEIGRVTASGAGEVAAKPKKFRAPRKQQRAA